MFTLKSWGIFSAIAPVLPNHFLVLPRDDFFAGDLRVVLFLGADFFFAVFFRADVFFRGTLAPSLRASDNPIAMACLRLVTFLPLPLRRVPRFFSRMTSSTFSPALLEYLAI